MVQFLMYVIIKLLQINIFIFKTKIIQKMIDYKNSLINLKTVIFNLKITNIQNLI